MPRTCVGLNVVNVNTVVNFHNNTLNNTYNAITHEGAGKHTCDLKCCEHEVPPMPEKPPGREWSGTRQQQHAMAYMYDRWVSSFQATREL